MQEIVHIPLQTSFFTTVVITSISELQLTLSLFTMDVPAGPGVNIYVCVLAWTMFLS